jgi:hypothetical protein
MKGMPELGREGLPHAAGEEACAEQLRHREQHNTDREKELGWGVHQGSRMWS